MAEQQSKIIPNSFQTPNYIVDRLMHLLTGNEQKCIDAICRKTFGWQKRSDRISKSQLMELTGLGVGTVDACMRDLVRYRIAVRVDETKANKGVEWAISLSGHSIDFKGLEARSARRRSSNHKRTEKARANQKVGMSNIPTKVGMSNIPTRGDVQHTPQKPLLKPDHKHSRGGLMNTNITQRGGAQNSAPHLSIGSSNNEPKGFKTLRRLAEVQDGD